MPTIPSYDMPQVQARTGGAQRVNINPVPIGPDPTILQGAARFAGDIIQKEQERADTAALMDAESKLSQARLDMMFNPESGVYSRTGKNALDITNQTLPQFDKTAESIGAGLSNPRQREQFARMLQSQRQQMSGELNRYEFTQRNAYYDQVDETNIKTSMQGAVQYANDPAQVAFSQSKATFVIGERGLRKGLPAEEILRQQQAASSGIHTGVIDRLTQRDPLAAQEYYAKNFTQMTVDDQDRVQKVLGTSVKQQMAGNIASSLWSKGDMGGGGLPQLVIQAESGGDPSAVSPKGALGLMQVMPETAEETAREMGVPFDRDRLLSDPAYNQAIGTFYLNKMLGRYSGDQALALAAYNAGPGAVDKWVKEIGDPRKGEISTAEFVQRIPYKETREYTSNILARSTSTSGVPASQRYADGLRVAGNIVDPQVRKYVMDNLEDRKKAATAQVNAMYDQAAEYVNDGGFQAIPASLLAQIPADEQIKLRRMDDYRRKGEEPPTDYSKMESFLRMPADQLAALSLEKDVRPYLSNSDFNTVRGAWQAAQSGDEKVQKRAAAEEKAVADVMNMAGIVTGNSKDANEKENIKKQMQFRAAIDSRKDAFRAAHNREPSITEVQDLAQQLLLEVKITGGGTFFGDSSSALWEVPPETLTKSYIDRGDIGIDDVPPGDRREIVNALRANGRVPSEANIIADYLNRISGLGVKIR
jgi:soluble lytic murein transglycosylase